MSEIMEHNGQPVPDYSRFYRILEDYAQKMARFTGNGLVDWCRGDHGRPCISDAVLINNHLLYYDPSVMTEAREELQRIHQVAGLEDPVHVPVVVVPIGAHDWVGIASDESSRLETVGPAARIPTIWHEYNLDLSQGAPIWFPTSIVDALAIEEAGQSAVWLGASCPADYARAVTEHSERLKKDPSGLLVLIASASEDQANAGKIATSMQQELIDAKELVGWCAPMKILMGEGGAAELLQRLDIFASEVTDSIAATKRLFESRRQDRRSDGFAHRIMKGARGEVCPTGNADLDRILDGGLFCGLYILGAVPSLGKTTFAIQMADLIAASGRDVLFFSGEMSEDEIIAKSLSRISAEVAGRTGQAGSFIDYADGVNASRILRGPKVMSEREQDALWRAMAMREPIERHLWIFDHDDMAPRADDPKQSATVRASIKARRNAIGLDTVRKELENYRIFSDGRVPVVFIDYLQALRPDQWMQGTDKQVMDDMMQSLRDISKHVPVFVISTLNRAAYNSKVSFESFKESGSIEYAADVIMALDLTTFRNAETDTETRKNKDARDTDNGKPVADITLSVLKDRMGGKGTVRMLFDRRYGLFIPWTEEAQERADAICATELTPDTLRWVDEDDNRDMFGGLR